MTQLAKALAHVLLNWAQFSRTHTVGGGTWILQAVLCPLTVHTPLYVHTYTRAVIAHMDTKQINKRKHKDDDEKRKKWNKRIIFIILQVNSQSTLCNPKTNLTFQDCWFCCLMIKMLGKNFLFSSVQTCVVCLTAEMSGFLLFFFFSVLPFKAKPENIVISLKHIACFKEKF